MSDGLEIDLLADSFATMLAAEWPRERAVAHGIDGKGDTAGLWENMAALGWTALTVPEEHGGLALGLDAAAQLNLALGAAVAPAPMLGTQLAIALIAGAGTDAQKAKWLPGLAEGSLKASVAEVGAGDVTIEGAVASGSVHNLLDPIGAHLLCLPAVSSGQSCWLVVEMPQAGVTLDPFPIKSAQTDRMRKGLTYNDDHSYPDPFKSQSDSTGSGNGLEQHPLADPSHTLGSLRLDALPVSAEHILTPPDPAALAKALQQLACVGLAADSLGGGQAVLDGTIEYLKVREQFGKVIGSFQALKHRIADHQTALVGARELVLHAASLPGDHPDALLMALSAKDHVTALAADLGRDAIQLFGGVGFTSEYFPHLYLKRARLNEALFGTRPALRDQIADLLEAAS